MEIYKFQLVRIALCFLSFFCTTSFCGCTKQSEKAKKTVDTEFELSIDGKPFLGQIAYSDSEKARGLMFRNSMKRNLGMVFPYKVAQQASFWMKDTNIPLDIGFFLADGTLTEVKQMYPHNLDSVKSSRNDIAYCIEMNLGWFAENGIFPPAKLDMVKLKAAIEARK